MGEQPEGPRPDAPGPGSRRGIVAALVVGVVVVALVVGRSALSSSSDDEGDGDATESADAAGSAAPGDGTTTDPDPPAATTTTAPPPAPPGPLPGLTAAGVTDAMSGAGWTCFQGEQERPDHVSTSCMEPGNVAQLEMLSTPAGEPVYVEATVFLTADAAHLQHVASLGWAGVDAAAVSAWIQDSIDSGDQPPFQRTFGAVPFELQGMPGAHTAWYLTIGRAPP